MVNYWIVSGWDDYLRFRDAFNAVMDPRRYSIEWLDAQLLLGNAHFLCSANAAIVFEQRFYPQGSSDVHGLLAAGDLNEIRTVLIPQAEAWGRNMGCIGAVIESREGWSKALKASGYEPYQASVRKAL